MITRYLNNRWWKMKEDADGQYVAYHDHEAEIEKLRYENDKLWERIAQQVEENKKLLKNQLDWRDDVCKLSVRNTKLNEELITRSILEIACTAILILGSLGWWVWG